MKVKAAAADVFNVMFLSVFKKMFLYEPCIVCDIFFKCSIPTITYGVYGKG